MATYIIDVNAHCSPFIKTPPYIRSSSLLTISFLRATAPVSPPLRPGPPSRQPSPLVREARPLGLSFSRFRSSPFFRRVPFHELISLPARAGLLTPERLCPPHLVSISLLLPLFLFFFQFLFPSLSPLLPIELPFSEFLLTLEDTPGTGVKERCSRRSFDGFSRRSRIRGTILAAALPTWCFGDPACSRYVGSMELSGWQ